jgi:hypothetical protein
VRCATSHFDRPAKANVLARKAGGQVVGSPSSQDQRWV